MDAIQKAKAAMEHCLAVFKSMADRGNYPRELMPDFIAGDGKELFLGKQGWEFLADAIRDLPPTATGSGEVSELVGEAMSFMKWMSDYWSNELGRTEPDFTVEDFQKAIESRLRSQGSEVASEDWKREGTTFYTLMHDCFRRGEEQFRNRIYFGVNFDRTVTESERERFLADLHSRLTRPAPVAREEGADLKPLVGYLAKAYKELDDLRGEMFKMKPEEVADAIVMKWPVIQGTGNQIRFRRLAEIPYTNEGVHAALNSLAPAPLPTPGASA